MVAQEDINNTVGVGYQVTPFSIGTPNLEFLAQAFNRISIDLNRQKVACIHRLRLWLFYALGCRRWLKERT